MTINECHKYKIIMSKLYADYFSRNTTEHLKGYLALAVLFHHMYQKTQIIDHASLLGFFMQSLGYYCVSLFFFISGYGLIKSANRGGIYKPISVTGCCQYL